MAKIAILITLLLTGCASDPERITVYETKEVQVPIYQKPAVPEDLRTPLTLDRLPEFISPTDPNASSALTPDGEKDLKLLIIELKSRLEAYEKWAN